MKTRPVGAELFHAGGGTVMTKLIVAFRHFAKALFCPVISGFVRTLLFKCCQTSPIYRSGKNNFKMTMSVER